MNLVLLLVIAVGLGLAWIFWTASRTSAHRRGPARRSVAILVLGDIGRSPRMMYHAESFSKAQFDTYLIGYGGECLLLLVD
jgi:beta-1,4-mannosyltransferase